MVCANVENKYQKLSEERKMLFKAYGSLLKNIVWRADTQWFTWCFKEIGEKLGGEEVNSQDFI